MTIINESTLIADPLGFDIFESIETFEGVMTSLAGVYFQLWFQEQKKPASERNELNAEKYRLRHSEVLRIKKTYPIGAIVERSKAIDTYSKELQEARSVLAAA